MMRWIDYIVKALENLDSQAPYADIYSEVKRLRISDGATLPRTWQANIRGRIEEHCDQVDGYIPGNPNLFYPPLGKGHGVWALTTNYDKEFYKIANKKGLIVAYSLAKFNIDAYKQFGLGSKYNTQKEVEKQLCIRLGMKQNSYLKRMRDRYDGHLFETRSGYHQNPLPDSFIKVAEFYENLEEEELYEIVEKLFNSDKHYNDSIEPIISNIQSKGKGKRKSNTNPQQRSKTGRKGEKLFIDYFNKNKGIILKNNKRIIGNLIDKRYDQCGYDFEIETKNNKFFIEVKSLSFDKGAISFTNKEWKEANKKKEHYILCTIYNVNSDIMEEFHFISDTSSKITPIKREQVVLQINYEVSNKKLKGII